MIKPLRTFATTAIILWLVAGEVWWLNINRTSQALLLELFFNILVMALIIASSSIVGYLIREKLKETADGLEAFLTSTALGLGIYALLLFFLGIAGLLYQPVVTIALGLPILLSAGRLKPFIDKKPWKRESLREPLSGLEILTVICIAAVGFLIFLEVLVPEIFYDALYYHDAFPLLYLIRHKVEIYPYAIHSAMPSNIDLLYVLPLSFSDAQAIRLMHFLFGVGSTLWIYVLGAKHFNRKSGLIGAMFWSTIPGVGRMAGLGAVDLGVVFFELGAIAMLLRWVFEKKGQGTLVASAFLLGIAVGSKYTALMVGVVCAVGIIAGAVKRKADMGLDGALKATMLFAVISLAAASPWYVNSWIEKGEPLYPALAKAGTPGKVAQENLHRDSQPSKYTTMQTFTKLPGDLWHMRGQFGAGSALGLGVIAFIPALIWGFWRRGPALWIGIASFAIYVMWSQSILIVRYMYPALALTSVLVGGMIAGKNDKKCHLETLAGLFLVIVTLSGMKNVAIFHESFHGGIVRYLASSTTSEEYLIRFAPHYGAAKFINENVEHNAKLFFIGETKGYYFQRDYMPVSAYDINPLVIWIKEAPEPSKLKNLLKSKGFTHIVINRGEWKRLRKKYGYLTLDKKEEEILESMLNTAKILYGDKYLEVFEL